MTTTFVPFERKKPVIVTGTKDMSREDWLQHRKVGFGGSDIAAIFGLDKYRSPMQVYLDKIGDWEDEGAGEAAYWGNVLEDVVAKEFMRRTLLETGEQISVQRRNAMFQHPDHSYMLANIDRKIVGQNGGLECKTASIYLKDEWLGEHIPDKYMLQVQHYMGVLDYDFMYVAVLIGGQQFSYKRIERDDEMIAMIAERAHAFWQLIVNRTPPAFDGSEASEKVLKKLYPKSEAPGIQLEQDAVYLAEQIDVWKEAKKEAEAKIAEAENQLKGLIGNHEQGFLNNGWTISWKSNNEFDEAKFAADHPVIYNDHLKKLDTAALKKTIGAKTYAEYQCPGKKRPFLINKPKEE